MKSPGIFYEQVRKAGRTIPSGVIRYCFAKSEKRVGEDCPDDLEQHVFKELKRQTALNPVWGLTEAGYDGDEYDEEETTTVQVELVSEIVKTIWWVYTLLVDDDTTMGIVSEVSQQVKELPENMK